MGYTTDFYGEVSITPPLNPHEIAYLRAFSDSRRMQRRKGPYYAEPGTNCGQSHDDDVLDYNKPPHDQPGLWCQWEPTDDGTAITWNGAEKFYDSADWMAYLIDTFLRPGATAQQDLPGPDNPGACGRPEWTYPDALRHFTFDHICNGEIDARGESPDDVWRLVVRDNRVVVQHGEITFSEETDVGIPSGTIKVTATRTDRPNGDQPVLTAATLALPSTAATFGDVDDAAATD